MNCLICKSKIKNKGVFTEPITGNQYLEFECNNCDFVFFSGKPADSNYYATITEIIGVDEKQYNIPEWRLRYLLKFLKSDTSDLKLLEIGCGYGNFLIELSKYIKHDNIYAVEFDKNKISSIEERGFNNIYLMDFNEFYEKYKDILKFDFIFAFHVLEHMPDPQDFIKKIKSILKPGGFFVFEVPDKNRFFKDSSGLFDYPPHHFTRWSLKSIEIFLQENGFKISEKHLPFNFSAYFNNFISLFLLRLSFIYKRITGKNKFHVETGSNIKIKTIESKINLKRIVLSIIKGLVSILSIPFLIIAFIPSYIYAIIKDKGFVIYVIARKND